MKNRMMMLLAFLAVFAFSAPALAAPPVGDDAAETGDSGSTGASEEVKEEDTDGADTEGDTEGVEGDTDGAVMGTGTGGEDAGPADEIETDEEAVEAAKGLYNAIQQKQWALALGLGLSLLVFGLRRLDVLSKVPAKAVPWVTSGLAVVGYVIAALMTEGAVISDAVLGGITAGVAAVGLWEMLLKHFLGAKEDPTPAEEEKSEA